MKRQIVINVPESILETIQADKMINNVQLVALQICIRNGILLPKGHGKLGDLGALSNYFWDNRSKLYTHKDLQIVLDDTPTIIPADTESED